MMIGEKQFVFCFFKLQIYSSDLNLLRSTSQNSPSLAFTLAVATDDADASDADASDADARQALSV